MYLSPLINDLIVDEGLKLKPYRDSVGKLTIGIGRNLDDVGITKEEAIFLCKTNIKEALDFANKYIWFYDLTPNRKKAILNMIFNLGASRFALFKNMIKALEVGDYKKAAGEALSSKWAQQVGKRANRIAEALING